MNITRTYSLRARYLFPIDRPPLRDAWITVADGRIVEIGSVPVGEPQDLGNVAILPALVNAHTHLEFSCLDKPLGQPGLPFTEWIREVVQWRRTEAAQERGNDWQSSAIRKGITESLRGGSVSLGEIATTPQQDGDGRYDPMRGVRFLEILGLADERHDELVATAERHVANFASGPRKSTAGLSPHAPYTVGPRLVESLAKLAASRGAAVAMHLAETREELELLDSGSGPFRNFLADLGAWHSGAIPRRSKPLDYLHLLATANRSLVIHGNYLTPREIEFVSRQRDRMSIVYCSRTHAYFAHDRYPLAEMFARGSNVALGTDSRASNPDLSMLNELRFVAKTHPDIPPETILRLATINGATALGMQESQGTLTIGKQANFVVLPLPEDERADPHELLIESPHDASLVVREGHLLDLDHILGDQELG